MTSVLGKIKDVPRDFFPQKFQLSCLKNMIILLFIYFFKLKTTNRPFFSHSVIYFYLFCGKKIKSNHLWIF